VGSSFVLSLGSSSLVQRFGTSRTTALIHDISNRLKRHTEKLASFVIVTFLFPLSTFRKPQVMLTKFDDIQFTTGA
jgi:hypothetical protein